MATPLRGTELTLARLSNRKADVEELLERQICILDDAQRGLSDDLHSGPGGLIRTLTDKDSRKLADLSKSLDAVVAMKIRMENHRKKEGKAMTQEELVQAAVLKLKGLTVDLLGPIINDLMQHHAQQAQTTPTSYIRATPAFKPAMDALRDISRT